MLTKTANICPVKSFKTRFEAQTYLGDTVITAQPKSTKPTRQRYYGVASGYQPGVYTDLETAHAQITDWATPSYRAFDTWAEAEAFVNGTDNDVQPPTKKRKTGPGSESTPTPAPEEKEKEKEVEHEPGEGPLPPGAEDGFDPRIILDQTTGKIAYKTPDQQRATKWVATGPTDNSMLNIYTDGSSLGNGGRGAVAGVGVYFGPRNPNNLSEPLPGTRQTNQRAELTAIQRALELAPRNRPVTIFSDSNYAIKCVTEWFVKWRQNGWVNAAKKPVENKDIVERVLYLLEERHSIGGQSAKVQFQWVKGHKNNEGNIAADELAVAGAREARSLSVAGKLGEEGEDRQQNEENKVDVPRVDHGEESS